jgi:hypothetical protein
MMLVERTGVLQKPGDGFRRWFTDSYFDLIIWYTDAAEKEITGFQLCYDKGYKERALTWRKNQGYAHDKIDDGEGNLATNKMSPILVQDGVFAHIEIRDKFLDAAVGLPSDLRELVRSKLEEYPGKG